MADDIEQIAAEMREAANVFFSASQMLAELPAPLSPIARGHLGLARSNVLQAVRRLEMVSRSIAAESAADAVMPSGE